MLFSLPTSPPSSASTRTPSTMGSFGRTPSHTCLQHGSWQRRRKFQSCVQCMSELPVHVCVFHLLCWQVVNLRCTFGLRIQWLPAMQSDRNLDTAAEWIGDPAEASPAKGLADVYRRWLSVPKQEAAAEAAGARCQQEQMGGFAAAPHVNACR